MCLCVLDSAAFAAAKPAYTVNSYPAATISRAATASTKPAYTAAAYTAATVNNYAMAYTNQQAAVAATVKAKPSKFTSHSIVKLDQGHEKEVC